MKKYEYRCDKCMIIEERWILGTGKPSNYIFCHKCGSEALRHPWPKSQKGVYKKNRDKLNIQTVLILEPK